MENGQKIQFQGPVYSVTESMEKIIQEKTFSLPLGLFKDTYKTSKYSVKIRNLKDEAKDEDVESGVDED